MKRIFDIFKLFGQVRTFLDKMTLVGPLALVGPGTGSNFLATLLDYIGRWRWCGRGRTSWSPCWTRLAAGVGGAGPGVKLLGHLVGLGLADGVGGAGVVLEHVGGGGTGVGGAADVVGVGGVGGVVVVLGSW